MARVLIVAGDAGGAAAVAPVASELRRCERLAPVMVAYGVAKGVWRRLGIPAEAAPADAGPEWARRKLRGVRPSLVLTGTSVNGRDLEKAFWRAARADGVPSMAVLDYWNSLDRRFAAADGLRVELPDHIAVMDERARADVIALGAPPSAVVVTGQPAFDGLRRARDAFGAGDRLRVRSSLGAGADDVLVLFVSQPIAAVFPAREPGRPSALGYDEIGVLRDLRAALARMASADVAVRLAIRPHPREDPAPIRALLADDPLLRGCRMTEAVFDGGDPRECVLAADVVVGMMSELLAEACWLGRPTVSYQPGLIRPDPLPVNAAGLSASAYRRQDLAPVLAPFVTNPDARRKRERALADVAPDGGAARRVADTVREIVGKSSEVEAA